MRQTILSMLCLAAAFVEIALLPKQTTYDDIPTTAERLTGYLLLGALVAIAWAVCFRSQIEKGRLSVFSLLVLITMEAAMLALDRFLNSGWMGGI